MEFLFIQTTPITVLTGSPFILTIGCRVGINESQSNRITKSARGRPNTGDERICQGISMISIQPFPPPLSPSQPNLHHHHQIFLRGMFGGSCLPKN